MPQCHRSPFTCINYILTSGCYVINNFKIVFCIENDNLNNHGIQKCLQIFFRKTKIVKTCNVMCDTQCCQNLNLFFH